MSDFHIFHEVEIGLSIPDAIRMLLGSKCRLRIQIKTNDENIEVLNTKTDIDIDRLFAKAKKQEQGGMSPLEQ